MFCATGRYTLVSIHALLLIKQIKSRVNWICSLSQICGHSKNSFFQHPAWFIMPINHKNCGLLLSYNNSEDTRNFHGFTGTINHSWLTNQSARIDSIAQRESDLFIMSMITDQIGRHGVLLSINHKNYNFRE